MKEIHLITLTTFKNVTLANFWKELHEGLRKIMEYNSGELKVVVQRYFAEAFIIHYISGTF